MRAVCGSVVDGQRVMAPGQHGDGLDWQQSAANEEEAWCDGHSQSQVLTALCGLTHAPGGQKRLGWQWRLTKGVQQFLCMC